jgi:trk system potassium uptake protein TrkA
MMCNGRLKSLGKPAHVQDRIVIVGGGNVGFSVAKNLENRSSRIRAKVIEKDRFTAEQAAELLEKTIVLHGDGLDADMLSRPILNAAMLFWR